MSANVLDFCRLCFREDGNISVFEYECGDDSWTIVDRIFECVSVKISQDDKLPQTVCEPCLQFIIRWCDFKTTCDRNQRTWFLWLKSLKLGSPEEIREGLSDNARKKCIELGYKSTSVTSSPEKGAFQPYNRSSRSGTLKQSCNDDSIIVIHEPLVDVESRCSNTKHLRIESTQSLVDFYDKDRVDSPQQKLTNGVLLVDSDNSVPGSEKGESSNLPQDSENNDLSERASEEGPPLEDSCEKRTEASDSEVPKETSENTVVPQDQTNPLAAAEVSENDPDNSDKEVENAFCQDAASIDAIPEREMALLNGDDPPVESIAMDEDIAEAGEAQAGNGDAETSSDPVNNNAKPSDCSTTELSEGNNITTIPQSMLKARLLQDIDNEVRTNIPTEQPRRPDTPYPHDILKNMAAKFSENSPMVQKNPSDLNTSIPVIPSFTAPGPVNSIPEVTLKPASLLHLIGKPHPPSSSSERMSESSISDSASYNIGVRIKQELMSDDGESEEDNESIYNNISIKMEPMELLQHPMEEAVAPDPDLDPNCTYCKLCRKRFSAPQQFVRHVHTSQLHKRVSSFAALGHKIDSQVIAQLNREVRSQAYFRAFAKKRMIAMERGKGEDGTSLLNSPAGARQPDHNLLECKICNIVLPSRSHKIKHDNSQTHQLNLEALMHNEAVASVAEDVVSLPQTPLSSQFPLQSPSSFQQATTYMCPFASCSATFGDGGQLIVHMHTHGISLPIHETNKQIQLSQERTQLNQLPTQINQQQSQFNQQITQFSQPQNQVKPKKQAPSRLVKTEVPSGSGKYNCRRCNRSFLKGMALSNHMRSCRVPISRATGPPTEKCPVCQIPQKNKRCLTYHIKMYHPESAATILVPPVDYSSEPRDFQCPTCSKSFRTKMCLNSHVHKVHRKMPAQCKICNKIFSTRSNLSAHYKIHLHLKEGEYLCHVCFQVFKSRRASYLHKKAGCSLKIKLFSCTECTFSFRSQESLDKHKEENHPEVVEAKVEEVVQLPVDTSCLDDMNNTACNLCDRVYSSYYNLKRHFKERHLNQSGVGTGDLSRVSISDSSTPIPSSGPQIDVSISNDSSAVNYNPPDPDKDNQCMYCDHKFTTRKSMFYHMKSSCRSVPPKEKCRSCKTERWPWFIGPCKECGKDMNIRVSKRSTSVAEPPSKKPRMSELSSTSTLQSPVPEPSFEVSKSPVINMKKTTKKPREILYKCPIGKRSFLSQKTMFSHSLSCNGTCKDQSVYCKVCHQLYPNPKIYLKHKPCTGKKRSQTSDSQKTSDPSRPFACEMCPVRFKTRSYCCKHMRTVHNHYSRFKRQNNNDATMRVKTRSVDSMNKSKDASGILNPNETDELPLQEVNEKDQNSELNITSSINDAPLEEPVCNLCSKTFSSHETLNDHLKNFHSKKFAKIDCTFCGTSILRRELYEHGFNCIRDQLSNINTLECVVCSTIFYSNDEEDTISLKLQEHILNCCGKLTAGKGEKFKNKEKFLCLKCCMLFSSKKSLYAHSFERHGILIQTSPNTQQKTNPSKGSTNRLEIPTSAEEVSTALENSTLSENIEPQSSSTPSATSPFKCFRCYKTFNTQKGLKCHKAITHVFRPSKKPKNKVSLKCKFCQRQFYSEMKLRNHEKVHGIVKEIVMTEGEDNKLEMESSPAPASEQEQPNRKLSVNEIIGIVLES